eukprot:SM000142S00527  [mRNA]  locus=s142:113038:117833:- [translate_table: standard]
MALRDLVMGGAGCSAPGAGPSSSANPLGGLAEALIGSTSKTQERLREVPSLTGHGVDRFGVGPLPGTSLPGSELEGRLGLPDSDFLRGFHGEVGAFADAWEDATRRPALAGPLPAPTHLQGYHALPPGSAEEAAMFGDFEHIYGQQSRVPPPFHLPDGQQQVLSSFLRSFMAAGHTAVPFQGVPLPDLGLSYVDKCKIRDRTSIMARHVFADRGDAFVDAQVSALLQALQIDGDSVKVQGPMGGRFTEFEDYWQEGAAGRNPAAQRWADEYTSSFGGRPGGWANEFQQEQQPGDAWANEFEQMGDAALMRPQNREMQHLAAQEQTRALVNTLSQNRDPKFQNSKFLQFVSKMSRGDLIVNGNQVKASGANGWAEEFDGLHHNRHNGGAWASEFTNTKCIFTVSKLSRKESAAKLWLDHMGNVSNFVQPTWEDEFVQERQRGVEGWASEFQKQHQGQDWANEFGDRLAEGVLENDGPVDQGWLDSYNQFVEEQVQGEAGATPSASRWAYVFSDQNPYVGHANPLSEGQGLFRRGLLSEAVLALEAEVLKNPNNAEGWRLLGISHAENDDDRQAIASMVRARDAEPSNLEVLLALGVSHTNELDQAEALHYLRSWLQNHPTYKGLIPPEQVDRLTHGEVASLFTEAVRLAPEDADVHTVLGVLFNLSREYERAIDAFQKALSLRKDDYSLWNKLGATQANSAHSSEAIEAYQQALDLKPNYVRAWSNMGIGYANQGRYEESIRYYVRALSMNPKAENAWQYLRISLSCMSRSDMLEACDRHDLALLQKEFPL